MSARSLTSSRPAVLAACGLLFSSFAAQAYPYDDSLNDLPTFITLSGIETRKDGTVATYNIPVNGYSSSIHFTTIKGGDGGNAKTSPDVGQDFEADGGRGAVISAKFAIDPYANNALRPGGELRFVVGSKGERRFTDDAACGGGGGGTAVLYRAPESGADWIILAVAGGGGGAASRAFYPVDYSRDGSDAETGTSGGDGRSNSDSGGDNGQRGVGIEAEAIVSGGGGGYLVQSYTEYTGTGGGTDGGNGGFTSTRGADGGFGFGGGGAGHSRDGTLAHDPDGYGGGGGGYSGGGAGSKGGGGGGGSFLHSWATDGNIAVIASPFQNGYIQYSLATTPNAPSLPGPTITIQGQNPVSIQSGGGYTDAGASAQDVYGNALTAKTTGNTVKSGTPGTYSVTYSALDQFGKTTTVTRTVQVLANKPTFSIDGDVSVDEDSGPFSRTSFAHDINANDSSQTVSQFIVTNDNQSLFATQPAISSGGKLTFTPADHASGSALVTVVAVDDPDDATNGSSDPLTFHINVNGIDDPPTHLAFTAGSLQENQTEAGTIGAVDPFGGDLSFILTGGADDGLFNLDESSGALSFLSPPDFENPSDSDQDGIYQVGVLVQGSDGDSTATFSFAVIDVNEAPSAPTLSNTTPLEHTTVVGTVSANDPEGVPLTYAITGGADQALFQIDATTGALSFLAAPDYENPTDANGDNIYQVEVGASDGVEVTSAFQIAVQDDTSPPTGIAVSVSEIPENQTDIGVVSATDPFGGEVTFAFDGGRDSDFFNLTQQGALNFKKQPDFENPKDFDDDNIYVLNIRATGSEGSIKVVRYLTVTNVDEAPSTPGLNSTSLEENTTLVGTLSASDPENQAVTFTISGGADQAMFTVSGESLSLISAPDFEAPADADQDGVYEVEITANDGANDSLPATFSITVTDAAESDLSEFRSTHGLASDGSDDNADWSQNSIENIFYYLFGLGDPNEPDIDRSLLPTLTPGDGEITFSYRSPFPSGSVYPFVVTSTDLQSWIGLDELAGDEAPVDITASEEPDGYLRHSITVPATATARFFSVRPGTTD